MLKPKKARKTILSAVVLMCTYCSLPMAWAADSPISPTLSTSNTSSNPGATNSSGLYDAVKKILALGEGMWAVDQSLLLQKDESLPQIMAANGSQQQFMQDSGISNDAINPDLFLPNKVDAYPPAITLTQQGIFNTLTNTSAGNMVDTLLATVPGVLASETPSSNYFSNPSSPRMLPQSQLAGYDLNSLLQPLAYTTAAQQQDAQNFVRFISGLAQPMDVLNFADLDAAQEKKAMQNAAVRSYLVSLREYGALMSVGLSNLYALYAERMPQPNLAAQADLPTNTPGYPNASPLQVEAFLARQRALNPEWYAKMAVASPATIARQTLYTLAEMRLQQFQEQMDLERLVAILSSVELQQAQAARGPLAQTISNLEQDEPFNQDNSKPKSGEAPIPLGT